MWLTLPRRFVFFFFLLVWLRLLRPHLQVVYNCSFVCRSSLPTLFLQLLPSNELFCLQPSQYLFGGYLRDGFPFVVFGFSIDKSE